MRCLIALCVLLGCLANSAEAQPHSSPTEVALILEQAIRAADEGNGEPPRIANASYRALFDVAFDPATLSEPNESQTHDPCHAASRVALAYLMFGWEQPPDPGGLDSGIDTAAFTSSMRENAIRFQNELFPIDAFRAACVAQALERAERLDLEIEGNWSIANAARGRAVNIISIAIRDADNPAYRDSNSEILLYAITSRFAFLNSPSLSERAELVGEINATQRSNLSTHEQRALDFIKYHLLHADCDRICRTAI